MSFVYLTDRNLVKVYRLDGTPVQTIQIKGTIVRVSGATVVIPQRGVCYPISAPFGGYVSRERLRIQPAPDAPPPVEEDPNLPPTRPPVPIPNPEGLWIVRGDEELAQYGMMSRTGSPTWSHPGRQTPSVFRYDIIPAEPTERRVNILAQDAALTQLNLYDGKRARVEYLKSPGTALFNRTGFPRLQLLVMSFNFLRGLAVVNGFLKFETLTPNSILTGMTHATHPHLVHKFDIVTIQTDAQGQRFTAHVPTPHGDVFWFLTTPSGFGFIPLRYVRPYQFGEE